jgi:hypothetical protein
MKAKFILLLSLCLGAPVISQAQSLDELFDLDAAFISELAGNFEKKCTCSCGDGPLTPVAIPAAIAAAVNEVEEAYRPPPRQPGGPWGPPTELDPPPPPPPGWTPDSYCTALNGESCVTADGKESTFSNCKKRYVIVDVAQ